MSTTDPTTDPTKTNTECNAGASLARDYRCVNLYQFLDDAITGKGGFSGETHDADSYTYLHKKDSEKEFIPRVKRSNNHNLQKPFITSQYAPVLADNPKTIVTIGDKIQEDHPYLEWQKNVDGNGLGINQYKGNTCKAGYNNAVTFMVMDKKPKGDEPYTYIQKAGSVDQSELIVGDYGELVQIAFINKRGEKDYTRTIWTDETVIIQKSEDCKEWKEHSKTDILIGEMPVKPVFFVDRENPRDYLPYPEDAFNVASSLVDIFNLQNHRTWHNTMQSLAHLAIIDGDLEAVGEGYTNGIKLSTNSGNSPDIRYVSADTGIAKSLKEDEIDAVARLIDIMAEAGVVLTQSQLAVVESGVARFYRFRGQQTKHKYTESILEVQVDPWLSKFYSLYQGLEFEAKTMYKGNYQYEEKPSIDQLINIAELFIGFKLDLSAKEVLKGIVKYGVEDKDALPKLIAEVDALELVKDPTGISTLDE